MLKVLVLTSEMQTSGGIQRYTRHLLRSLVEINGSSSVQAVSVRAQPSDSPRRLSLREKAAFALRSSYRAATFRPHLVICNHVGLARVAVLLKQLCGVPYIVVAHGVEVWGDVRRRLFDEAAMVVSVSRFTARVLAEKHRVDERKIALLPPAIEPDLFKQASQADEIIERHRLRGKRVLLTVARMMANEQYKGHDVVIRSLVEARQAIPNLVYVIVGDGDDRSRLERLVRELGLGNAVIFAGAVEERQLPAYYQACDVFIMPSRTQTVEPCLGEGFGIVYVEAAAFGKPAIAGRDGGSADAVADGVAGILVDVTSTDETAQAIVRLFSDDQLRRTLGEQARVRALTEFTLDRFQHNLRSILSAHETRGVTRKEEWDLVQRF